jgi:hypothetical protein
MAQQPPYPITLDERRLATRPRRCSVPAAMVAMGQEDQFPPPRLSACYVIREKTFAEMHGNGRDAPKPVISANRRKGSTPAAVCMARETWAARGSSRTHAETGTDVRR